MACNPCNDKKKKNVTCCGSTTTETTTKVTKTGGALCEMPTGAVQYVGARYVPVFADPIEWAADRPYEHLMMVQHEGGTYISRQAVPVGVSLDNEEYWVYLTAWNAQIEQYRQEVLQYDERITDVETDVSNVDSELEDTKLRVTANENNITALTTRVSNAEDDISDIGEALPIGEFNDKTVKDALDDIARNANLANIPAYGVVAHRGFSNGAPENTLAAFNMAGESRAQLCESDIRITSDGVCVCMHDADLSRTTNGTGNVSERAYSYIEGLKVDSGSNIATFNKERVPRLTEFLEVCKTYRMTPIIELKGTMTQEDAKIVLGDIDKCGMTYNCICSSFSAATLQNMHAVAPHIPLIHIFGAGDFTEARINADIATGIYSGFMYVVADANLAIEEIANNAGMWLATYSGAVPANWPEVMPYTTFILADNPFYHLTRGSHAKETARYYVPVSPVIRSQRGMLPTYSNNMLAPLWGADGVLFSDPSTSNETEMHEEGPATQKICLYLGKHKSGDFITLNLNETLVNDNNAYMGVCYQTNKWDRFNNLNSNVLQMPYDHAADGTPIVIERDICYTQSLMDNITPGDIKMMLGVFESKTLMRSDQVKELLLSATYYTINFKEMPRQVAPVVGKMVPCAGKNSVTVNGTCSISGFDNTKLRSKCATYDKTNGNLIKDYGWKANNFTFTFTEGETSNSNAVAAIGVLFPEDDLWKNYSTTVTDASIARCSTLNVEFTTA